MSTEFWRGRLHELLEQRRAAGYALPGHPHAITESSPIIDHVASRLHQEEMAELREHWRETGAQRRQAEGKAYVDAVLTRHRTRQQERRKLAIRRIGLEMRARDMDGVLQRIRAGSR